MSILVGKKSRVLIQGLGREGLFHAQQCKAYGTTVVGAVKPGKGGTIQAGFRLFDTVREAVRRTKANVSVIFVPAPFAADAILEAIDAEMPLIVAVTEGIPTRDMIHVFGRLRRSHGRLIGPNCPGVISPGQCKVGIMPGFIHQPGRVGVVSRSGTLTYEAVGQLSALGIGQSTCIGIGGDPIIGLKFIDALALFNDDPATDAVVMIGEIGGTAEEEAAAWVKKHMTKPVVAFIAGRTAPPGRRMGHAGAIISGGKGTAAEKMAALKKAGITVCDNPGEIGANVATVLAGRKPARARKAAAKGGLARPGAQTSGRQSAGRKRPAKSKTQRKRAKPAPRKQTAKPAKPAGRKNSTTKRSASGPKRTPRRK